MNKKGYLILENGQIFEGISVGAEKQVTGEVVFNTGMVGYPEGFTDPSYFGQILTMTYPLIGNYGVTDKKTWESDRLQIRGLIVSSYIDNKSHYTASQTLSDWLKKEGIPALANIDTRTLTKIIREFGVMKGQITFSPPIKSGLFFDDIKDDNLLPYVSCKKPSVYKGGDFRILTLDCGLKENQIRIWQKLKVTVIRVPWDYDPFKKGSDLKVNQGLTPVKFDAVFISNGPGDPKQAVRTIEIVREAIKREFPLLGICLGNQILALAAKADTFKLKYGHRGQNQPVKDEISGRCYITTQNHGFAVDIKTLPEGWIPWFTNLNDDTNEGIRHKKLPFLSCQFHPEATPGPTDTEWIFEYFLTEAKKWLKKP
ncbi:carbamoyl phosphate synthase small subunit [Candidatus Gottesmanbacteria bacterium RIFCSPLOWO2_01_FULL_39_12b]|uniref:Carbamoyl phosphate synthase small chain n=1 Tax=Candidatus Gottesmanbacteria bacterium RIFCSPLOWO2_01_FULL_39_12b TaxID=1798388 RepID=A0A1F6AQ49_9BACT|nr:MAG: carbamoyl phosphate synthase small subunit [Candidatus Gottesmanbacteria bacterium RIFCSPLOWO2_01_FULL_39_12b]